MLSPLSVRSAVEKYAVHVIGTPTHINAPALLSSEHGNTTFGDMCTAETAPRGSRRDAFDLVKQPTVDSLYICMCSSTFFLLFFAIIIIGRCHLQSAAAAMSPAPDAAAAAPLEAAAAATAHRHRQSPMRLPLLRRGGSPRRQLFGQFLAAGTRCTCCALTEAAPGCRQVAELQSVRKCSIIYTCGCTVNSILQLV